MDAFTLEKLEFDQVRQILARYCRSVLGRRLALRIGPSRRPETVRRWLEETSQMVAALREAGPPPLAGVTDIGQRLRRARPGGGASGEDFAVIASTLEAVTAVRRWTQGLPEGLGLLSELGSSLPEFSAEVEAIRSVVDSRGQVLDVASTTLARIRREVARTRQKVHDVIYGYARRPEVARILQDPVVTLHEDRFVLPVKAERRHELPGVVHRTSQSGATVFVEPNESVELNNHLAELLDAERREIARLLNDLAIMLERRHEVIPPALRTLAQLDVICAKAQYAYQFDLICPEMTERGGLRLHRASHPLLLEQAYQQERQGIPPEQRHPVVPIDVRLGVDFDVLVVTGSNTGGKTVALKTVGLLAVMAQSGMHIPAGRGTTLPLFRNVLLDVGDEQSLQQSLSTFGAHIRRVRQILRKADRYTLVLLDELGSGTDPDEGGAIGQAVLDELCRIGCLAMVSTHLGVLKAYAFNHERVDNASVEFDTRTLRPTYHLRIGEPGESHAITVAAAMGLPKHVVAAARKHFGQRGRAFRRAIRATLHSRRESEQARSQADAARIAAESAQEQYAAKMAQLHQLQERFESWVASLAELRPGDEIQVPSLKKTGRLVRVQFNKQIAVVDVDNLQVEVPLAELMPDLGQGEVRREIASLREQVLAQARQAEAARAEAERLHREYQHSLQQQKARQQQYEQWLAELARARVGQTVSIARAPGTGKLLALNLAVGLAKVQTARGVLELAVQELFPQVGPFARTAQRRPRRGRAQHGVKSGAGKDRPITRRRPDSAAARANREAVLKTAPGEQVYVVPFHKRATLIRFNHDRDEAVVQAGAFEMEIPIADLEPAR
ncbi:MAG: hypothetical protein B1H04_00655 [Planctomycetales bacterium 4484_123]|nr:MAG: hypothetical protein B1H04_00655 [Planctomycetales bacterium 4484_123]